MGPLGGTLADGGRRSSSIIRDEMNSNGHGGLAGESVEGKYFLGEDLGVIP